jgi:4-amino-4-deoxy-L-arabinose transferase-like glycosyltransferase
MRHGRARLQRIAYVSVALAVVAAIAVPRIALLILPQNADQGLFITIGEVVKHGGVVGRDTWDNKPPGTYYLYAAILAFVPDYSQSCTIGGRPLPWPERQFACAQVALSTFDALYAVAVAAAVWWFGWRLFGPAAGALATVLCAVFASMLQILNGGGMPDFHVLLPNTLAYAGALHFAETNRQRWLVVAGTLGGVAFLFKQTGLVLLAGIGLWLLVSTSFWTPSSQPRAAMRACAALTLGAGSVLAVTGLILAAVGALPDVIQQAFLFNRFYVGSPANVNNIFTQIRTQSWNVFTGSQAGLWLAAFGGLGPLLGLARDKRVSLLVAWLVASGASLLLGGAHLHDYYYLGLIPAFSVCGGWAVARLWHSSGPFARVWLVATAAALLGYSSQFQMHQYGNAWYSRLVSTTHTAEEFVAGSIKGGSGALYVWGNGSQVYALSGRPPASRYFNTLALSYDYAVHDQLERNRAELMLALERAPPEVIAVDTPWLRRAKTLEFPELRALLTREYRLTNSPSNPIFEGWEVYHRLAAT